MNRAYVSKGSRIPCHRAFAVAVFATLVITLNGWQEAAPMVENLLSLVGWGLVAIGVTGRTWCGSYISGHKTTTLVVEGPYSICRNPLYFFSFVGGLGVMLMTETMLLPILFMVLFWSYYPQVIAREEGTLARLHGATFEAYCSRVPRFWPSFSSYSEPASYMIAAAKFRKHLGQAGWFVMAGGVIEFIEGMHISGYLPTLLRIY